MCGTCGSSHSRLGESALSETSRKRASSDVITINVLARRLHLGYAERAMLSFKHILFPIDFSNRSCGAVPYVEAFASRFGAKITLLSVAQPFYYTGMGDPGGPVV